MNRQARGQELEAQVEEAIAELEAQLNEGHSEGFLQVLEWYSQFHSYSPLNVLLIMMQRPTAKLCAGFKKWEKLGYKVKSGEKAIWIRGPMLKKYTDPETGEITERLIGYIAVPVFAQDQLEGDVQLPTFREALNGDYETYLALAVSAMGAEGILVVEDNLPFGVNGMSMGGRVVISKDLPPSGKFNTALHEWCHEVLHHGDDRGETTRHQRELEAESSAFVLARIYGLNNPYSRDYVLNWKGTVEGLHDSMTRIHLAVKTISTKLGIEPIEQMSKTAA